MINLKNGVLRLLLLSFCVVMLVAPMHKSLAANEDVKKTQQILTDLGYQPGLADGLFGSKTRQALMQYQEDNSLPKTGQIDKATAKALGVEEYTPTSKVIAEQVWLDLGGGMVLSVGKQRSVLGASGFRDDSSSFVRVFAVKTKTTAEMLNLEMGKAYLVVDTEKGREYEYIRDFDLSLNDKEICNLFGVNKKD